MMKQLFDDEILVEDDNRVLSVGIYSHKPQLIDVCSQDGGSALTIQEAKRLIEILQKAIDFIEASDAT